MTNWSVPVGKSLATARLSNSLSDSPAPAFVVVLSRVRGLSILLPAFARAAGAPRSRKCLWHREASATAPVSCYTGISLQFFQTERA